MANYNSYNSIGIDFKIKMIQDALFNLLGFSNVDFYGRVQKSLNKGIKTIVPEVHISKSERKEVYYDDINAPGGNVFFVEEDDKHTTKDGIVFTAKIKIVFMLNLEKLYPNSTTRNDSEVQEYIIKLIRKLRVLEINAVEKGLNNVLKGFSTENIKLNDMQPYHIFSINGTLNYMYSCGELISGNKNSEITPPTPTCLVPVISGIPNNQFRDRIYVTVGVAKNWQIIGSNSPTSYNASYGSIQGVTVNQQTGAVTYTALPQNLGQTLTISFEATNSCGVGSLVRFIEPIITNVSILNAPINQSAYNINPNLPTRSFNYQNEILPYEGTLTNYEVWVNGPAFSNQWFLFSNVTPSNENLIGNIQTFVGLGQNPGTYLVKTRIKNNLGEYSPYTNELEIIVP